MTPLPLLTSTSLTAPPPGVPRPVAPGLPSFGDLLPALVRPVQPRKGDAGDGKDLPASVEDDGEEGAAWAVAPVLPMLCPPVPVEVGEGGSSLVTPALSRHPASAPASGDEESGTPAQGRGDEEGAVPLAPTAELPGAGRGPATQVSLLDPGLRQVGPALLGNIMPTPQTGVQIAAPLIEAPAITGASAALVPPLLPGEGRGPVTQVPTLAPGLRRDTIAPTIGKPDGATAVPSITIAKEPAAIADVRAEKLASTPAIPAPAPPATDPSATPRIAPAGEVFAAAIRQAVREERRPALTDAITLVAPAAAPTAVQATNSAQQPALDMGRETWPTKMIERIEALRDAADASNTSIRLLPDRLGAIDVSLRREGERVEVNLHAHQPETRALLAEAQPKLVEMGDARGLRLSTSTDTAGGQPQSQQQRAPTQPTHPATPRRAPADTADTTDQRLA